MVGSRQPPDDLEPTPDEVTAAAVAPAGQAASEKGSTTPKRHAAAPLATSIPPVFPPSPSASKPLDLAFPPGSAGAMDIGVAAEVLRRVNRTRQVVSLVSQVIIRSYDEEALHGEVCRFLVTFGGYLMAWVGLTDEKLKTIRPVAQAGLEANFLAALKITWSNDLSNRGPTSRAVGELRPHVARHIPTDPRLVGLRPEAKLFGYTATCAVPLQFGGHGTGVLTIHAAEPDAFGSEEVSLLRELANDLAAGVIGLRERSIRQSLEEATGRAESRYRRIIENAHEGIFECTPEGKLLLVNDALVRVLGYTSAQEMLDVAPSTLATHVHPDDVKFLMTTSGAPTRSVHVRMRTRARTLVWVAINIEVVEQTDGPLRVGFVQDMTLLRSEREASARLASVVDAADEAIVGTDVHGAITDWNEGASRLFGYTRGEALGRPLVDLIVPPERAAENAAVVAAIAKGERVAPFETVRRCKEKRLVHTLVTVNPIFAGDRDLVGATIVEHDITRASVSAATRRAKDLQDAEVTKLKELEKIRRTFMSEASHELNTPLTPIRIHVEALREAKDLPAAHRDHLAVIDRNVLRLCNLVKDMLEASRLETGRFALETTPTPLGGLLEDVVQGLADMAIERGITLELGPRTRLVVDVDRNRIGQVLYNLVTNALSFTCEGGSVTVNARLEADHALVCVKDEGVGLSADQIAQLFQPFARPHESMGVAPKGTGLGLFISKGIIEQHGGRIWVESDGPGWGAAFCFTLRLAEALHHGRGRADENLTGGTPSGRRPSKEPTTVGGARDETPESQELRATEARKAARPA